MWWVDLGWLPAAYPASVSFLSLTVEENKVKKTLGWNKDRKITYHLLLRAKQTQPKQKQYNFPPIKNRLGWWSAKKKVKTLFPHSPLLRIIESLELKGISKGHLVQPAYNEQLNQVLRVLSSLTLNVSTDRTPTIPLSNLCQCFTIFLDSVKFSFMKFSSIPLGLWQIQAQTSSKPATSWSVMLKDLQSALGRTAYFCLIWVQFP